MVTDNDVRAETVGVGNEHPIPSTSFARLINVDAEHDSSTEFMDEGM